MLPALLACSADPEVVVEQSSPYVPYARELRVAFDRAVALDVHATDGQSERDLHFEPAASHAVPLVALYPDRTWTVTVSADGRYADGFELTTIPLRVPFPERTLRASASERMAPGLTLVSMSGAATCLAAFDEHGEVAWLYDDPTTGFQEVAERDGHLFVLRNDYVLVEMDWLGRPIHQWSGREDAGEDTIAIEPARLHHEALQTESGSFALLAAARTTAPRYPDDYEDPTYGPAEIQTDRLWEVDPETGGTLAAYDMSELLDTSRIGFESLTEVDLGADWSHTNAIARDAERGLWIVSLRHQDAIVAFDDDGEIAWILGDPFGWTEPWASKLLVPEDGLVWPYHQHGIKWRDGRLLMFDNHNYATLPFSGVSPEWPDTLVTRLVEYEVDPEAMTVRMAWTWGPSPRVFSNSLGDADWLANGDVLGLFGDIRNENGVLMADLGLGLSTVRVIEVDPATGEAVFDLELSAPATSDAADARAYRAARVADPR